MIPSSPEGLAAFDSALFSACAFMRPPEKLSLAEWADKYGMLSSEGSSQPGKWYTSNAEYQRGPMEALTDPQYQSVVLMWGSQLGKTQIALFFSAYHMQHDPAPILFVEPDENLAKAISKERVDPMIRDTPVLKALFRDSRTRRSGNDIFQKSYPGGQITFTWASSPTGLASRPIRVLITDESGAYAGAPNREGNPVKLSRTRQATFFNRKHLDPSTPRLKRTCYITDHYERSDKRRFYVACPECTHEQVFVWPQMRWPLKPDGSADSENCWYECECCAHQIRESDKYAMIRAGRWIAENPGGGDGRTAGYQLNSLYSTIGLTWRELVDEFVACEGVPDKLQAFVNTKLGLPWDEQAEGADLSEIAKHAEEYAAPAPEWVALITCGADVQKDRIEATKWGWGLHDVSGVLEHRIFRGDPARDPDVWQRFDAWRRQRMQHETGLMLSTAATFVDSGDGNRTQSVYEYTRRLEGANVYACKGSSQPGAPLVNRGNRVGKYRTLVVSVGTSTAKDTIYARLKIADRDASGYIHFPNSLDSGVDREFFKHLTAEVLVTRTTKQGEESRWENPHRRNEALDCGVYAMAAKEFLRAPLKELARRMQERAAKLRAEGRLPSPQSSAPTPSASSSRAALPPSTSSAATAPTAAPGNTPPELQRKSAITQQRRKKIFRRPGNAWILGH